MKLHHILICVMALSAPLASALEPMAADSIHHFSRRQSSNTKKRPFIEGDVDLSFLDEKVIVGRDTVSIIIPERNFGRYDRGLFNYLMIPKGQVAFGLTANYGTFSSDDLKFMSIVDDFDFKGTIYSIKPTFSYFFRNNQSVGLKFNFTRGEANLDNITVDLDDLGFSIHGVKYSSSTISGGIFYRNYVGLGRSRRFAVFNEVDLNFGGGRSRFLRYYNDEPRDTQTNIFQASLNFSPGVCVFIMDYISFNISFGVFGVNFTNEKQTTNGVEDGSRFYSNANFKFNIFNINFGLGIHI